MEFSRQEHCSVLTQGSSLGLLHCRQILYHLSHLGSPPPPPQWHQPLGTVVQWTAGGHRPKPPSGKSLLLLWGTSVNSQLPSAQDNCAPETSLPKVRSKDRSLSGVEVCTILKSQPHSRAACGVDRGDRPVIKVQLLPSSTFSLPSPKGLAHKWHAR